MHVHTRHSIRWMWSGTSHDSHNDIDNAIAVHTQSKAKHNKHRRGRSASQRLMNNAMEKAARLQWRCCMTGMQLSRISHHHRVDQMAKGPSNFSVSQ